MTCSTTDSVRLLLALLKPELQESTSCLVHHCEVEHAALGEWAECHEPGDGLNTIRTQHLPNGPLQRCHAPYQHTVGAWHFHKRFKVSFHEIIFQGGFHKKFKTDTDARELGVIHESNYSYRLT